MAKVSTLQAALSNQTGKAKLATLAVPSDQVAVAKPKTPVAPSRIGQVNVSAYLPIGLSGQLAPPLRAVGPSAAGVDRRGSE